MQVTWANADVVYRHHEDKHLILYKYTRALRWLSVVIPSTLQCMALIMRKHGNPPGCPAFRPVHPVRTYKCALHVYDGGVYNIDSRPSIARYSSSLRAQSLGARGSGLSVHHGGCAPSTALPLVPGGRGLTIGRRGVGWRPFVIRPSCLVGRFAIRPRRGPHGRCAGYGTTRTNTGVPFSRV